MPRQLQTSGFSKHSISNDRGRCSSKWFFCPRVYIKRYISQLTENTRNHRNHWKEQKSKPLSLFPFLLKRTQINQKIRRQHSFSSFPLPCAAAARARTTNLLLTYSTLSPRGHETISSFWPKACVDPIADFSHSLMFRSSSSSSSLSFQ